MVYFVTGGTGFIGRFLVARLLARGGKVYLLVRKSSLARAEELREFWGAQDGQLELVRGDLSVNRLGVSGAIQGRLKHRIDHFFHLGAECDPAADERARIETNVGGTRRALALAQVLHAGRFHFLSQVAAAGQYPGIMDEATIAEDAGRPLSRGDCEAESLVRAVSSMPWRIYRPGIVVGDSHSGEKDRIDGLYCFFEAIRRLSLTLPPWLRGAVLNGGHLNLVPVDFVVDALDELAHGKKRDGETFLLTHPEGSSVGEVFALLLHLAGGPRVSSLATPLPGGLLDVCLPWVGRLLSRPGLGGRLLRPLGIPPQAFELLFCPTRFDSSRTQAQLASRGIHCPDFEDYAEAIWCYWQDNLRDEPERDSTWEAMFDGILKALP